MAVKKRLRHDCNTRSGDQIHLGKYFSERAEAASILPYPEKLDLDKSDSGQPKEAFGSHGMFLDIHGQMTRGADVVAFVHGFSVNWHQAVGSAMALQVMLNQEAVGSKRKKFVVLLFTWPSDGAKIPWYSYASDRSEAKTSGYALGRAILKVRDFLVHIGVSDDLDDCNHSIHMLCHSMGNYVFQKSLKRLCQHTATHSLPKVLDHVFMCSPDVDDDVLEQGKPLESIHEVASGVTVYHNKDDMALKTSDWTKGNPERLGSAGAARPRSLHHKIHQLNCKNVVTGKIQHSYVSGA